MDLFHYFKTRVLSNIQPFNPHSKWVAAFNLKPTSLNLQNDPQFTLKSEKVTWIREIQCSDHQWSVCISPKTCEAVRLFMCLLTNSIFSLNYLFPAFGHFSVRLYVLKPIRISFVCYICSKYFLSVIWILTFDSFFLVLKFFIFME